MAPVRSIILRKQERGEADEIVKFLSRDLGWLTGVAKNSKKSRFRFGGSLEPFSLVDLVLRSRRKDDMVWIDEAQVVRGFMSLRQDIKKVAWAAYFMEIASLFLPEAEPDPDLFDFTLDFLSRLEEGDPSLIRLILMEILLLRILGFEPRFDQCPACGQAFSKGQDAVFSPELGGACHRACLDTEEMRRLSAAEASSGRQGRGNCDAITALLLSPDTLAVVRQGLKVGPDRADRFKLNRKGFDELRRALSCFVRRVRGEQINSLLFLERVALQSPEPR